MGKPQRASSAALVSGLQIAAMESSVPLLKYLSYLLYLFLFWVAFRAPIFCGVLYKCRGRNGLQKADGREGSEWAESSSKAERGHQGDEDTYCCKGTVIPSSGTPDTRHFTFLILLVLLSLYVLHLPFVFQNFSCKLQILFILPLLYERLGDSALLWGLPCPGLNWSCPEDDFIFSRFLCTAVVWSSPECLIH